MDKDDVDALLSWCDEMEAKYASPTEYDYGVLMAVAGLRQKLAALRQQRGEERDYKALYFDLLYQVGKKHPGETRHETAKRYLQNAERGYGATQAKAALKERTE